MPHVVEIDKGGTLLTSLLGKGLLEAHLLVEPIENGYQIFSSCVFVESDLLIGCAHVLDSFYDGITFFASI